LPDNNRNHQSNVLLIERVRDAVAKDAEEDSGDLLSAKVRYVKVTMEGGPNDSFDGPGEPLPEPFKDPTR
jgi:hypothetical protein